MNGIRYNVDEATKILRESGYKFEEIMDVRTVFRGISIVYININGKWKRLYRMDERKEVTSHNLSWVKKCSHMDHSEIAEFFSRIVRFGAEETEDSFCIIDCESDG